MLSCAHRVPRVTRLYHDTLKSACPCGKLLTYIYIYICISIHPSIHANTHTRHTSYTVILFSMSYACPHLCVCVRSVSGLYDTTRHHDTTTSSHHHTTLPPYRLTALPPYHHTPQQKQQHMSVSRYADIESTAKMFIHIHQLFRVQYTSF